MLRKIISLAVILSFTFSNVSYAQPYKNLRQMTTEGGGVVADLSKNLGGSKSHILVDAVIKDMIKVGRVINLRLRDGVYYRPKFIEQEPVSYTPNIMLLHEDYDPSNIVAKPLLTPIQLERLMKYLRKRNVDPEWVTIGIIEGESMVNPAGDDEFTIVHVGGMNHIIYIGELLLKDILKHEVGQDPQANRIFDHDAKHITDPIEAYEEHRSKKYTKLAREVRERCKKLKFTALAASRSTTQPRNLGGTLAQAPGTQPRNPDGTFAQKPGGSAEEVLKTIQTNPQLWRKKGFTLSELINVHKSTVTPQTLRRDLNKLADTGLIEVEQEEGGENIYYVMESGMPVDHKINRAKRTLAQNLGAGIDITYDTTRLVNIALDPATPSKAVAKITQLLEEIRNKFSEDAEYYKQHLKGRPYAYNRQAARQEYDRLWNSGRQDDRDKAERMLVDERMAPEYARAEKIYDTCVAALSKIKASNLPSYTGAGDTAIHAALADAEKKVSSGETNLAKVILEELIADLQTAQKTENIEGLMAKWDEKYPSSLQVDLALADIPVAINEAEGLLDIIHQQEQALTKIRAIGNVVDKEILTSAKIGEAIYNEFNIPAKPAEGFVFSSELVFESGGIELLDKLANIMSEGSKIAIPILHVDKKRYIDDTEGWEHYSEYPYATELSVKQIISNIPRKDSVLMVRFADIPEKAGSTLQTMGIKDESITYVDAKELAQEVITRLEQGLPGRGQEPSGLIVSINAVAEGLGAVLVGLANRGTPIYIVKGKDNEAQRKLVHELNRQITSEENRIEIAYTAEEAVLNLEASVGTEGKITYIGTEEEITQLPEKVKKIIGNNVIIAKKIIEALGQIPNMRQMLDEFKQSCVVLGLV